MPIIKAEKQKDNVAKFAYDTAKIILTITVIGPLAKPDTFNFFVFLAGFIVAVLLFVFGLVFDGKEVKQ
jgi:hypothetical protein